MFVYKTLLLFLVAMAAALPQNCGNSPMQAERIVGGVQAETTDIPWQAILKYVNGDSLRCGGSIIDPYWIVTAAHCVHNLDPSTVYWMVGEYNTQITEGTEQRLAAVEYRVHANYVPATQLNDIALVKLNAPILFNDFVQPVCLPTEGYAASGNGVASGWGNLVGLPLVPVYPDKLHKVTIPMVSDEDCQEAYDNNEIASSMLCAGVPALLFGKDTCQGDSGGPFVNTNAIGRWQLVGITSWGIGCAQEPYYGVYTEVAHFKSWIVQQLARANQKYHKYSFIKQMQPEMIH